LFATVYRLVADDLVPMVTTTSENVYIVRDQWGEDQHVDRIAITTGTLRSALREQILFSWTSGAATGSTGLASLICTFSDTYDFCRQMTARVAVLDVTAGGTPWTISGWNTGRVTTTLTAPCWPIAASRRTSNPPRRVQSRHRGGRPVGRRDRRGRARGDEQDDRLPDGPGDSLVNAAEISRSAPYTDPSRRVVAIADLDVNPDGPQRWVPRSSSRTGRRRPPARACACSGPW